MKIFQYGGRHRDHVTSHVTHWGQWKYASRSWHAVGNHRRQLKLMYRSKISGRGPKHCSGSKFQCRLRPAKNRSRPDWNLEVVSNFTCFANDVIHPWSVARWCWYIPPRNAQIKAIFGLIHNFVYTSPVWRTREKHPLKTSEILFLIVTAIFGTRYQRTPLHGLKTNLASWILKQIFQDGSCQPARWCWAGNTPANLSVSDSTNMLNIS